MAMDIFPQAWYSYLYQCHCALRQLYNQLFRNCSTLLVKDQSTKLGLFVTFIPLSLELRSFMLELESWCNSGQCISAADKVKNIVGGPLYAIIDLRSCFNLYHYTELPAMCATYLDIFVINNCDFFSLTMFLSSFNVKYACLGFCWKKTAVCCSVHFLWIMFRAQYENPRVWSKPEVKFSICLICSLKGTSLCKHWFVGSSLPSGKNLGKA